MIYSIAWCGYHLLEPKPPNAVDVCAVGAPKDGGLNENDGAADAAPNGCVPRVPVPSVEPKVLVAPNPPNAVGAKIEVMIDFSFFL